MCKRKRAIRDTESAKFASHADADALGDQAFALYVKLRALQNNHAAASEVGAAIHRWINSDPMRRTAYDRAREVWRRGQDANQERRMTGFTFNRIDHASSAIPDAQSPGRPSSLDWSDVALLVCVCLLLLPMIYFLLVPAPG